MRPDETIGDALATDTRAAQALLETLRNGPSGGLAEQFPELGALATAAPGYLAVEHEGDGRQPLLDHLSVRVLGRKLRGLELGAPEVFQRDDALSSAAFAEEADICRHADEHGLLSCVRTALVFCDFTKGGTEERRRYWRRLGIDLSVHNLASARVVENQRVLDRIPVLRDRPPLARLTVALIESHGLSGQHVRGETPMSLFAPFVRYLRADVPALAATLRVTEPEALDLAVDCLHLVDVCDTAGVREGLLDDRLRDELAEIASRLRELGGREEPTDPGAIASELAVYEEQLWRRAHPEATDVELARARLRGRLARLRRGRLEAGEPATAVGEVVSGLDDSAIVELSRLLRNAQLWYCEPATGGLRPRAQVGVLALALRVADRHPDIDVARPYHVTFQPLVPALHDDDDGKTRYRRRLVETVLGPLSVDRILADDPDATRLMRAPGQREDPTVLAGFTTHIGGTTAVGIELTESEEAGALLTLLSIYERKSSAAFHTTLKALCDLYGLRKDEFDRVANESNYLSTMNAALADKARMLAYARPGRIVEVGPGGGVVLDLLAERFGDSEIIGVDASRLVVEALRRRQRREGRRWNVALADAFELPARFDETSLDTVIFCSVLHEIYSYVPWPTRFQLESVRDLLRAAWQTLKPGGRLLIRDGVAPEPGTRRIRFVDPEARRTFELFVEQFEPRRIEYRQLSPDRVELSAADAMEFLYTYTWGPESFPYEVREQYGVLPYQDYLQHIATWLRGPEHRVRFIELPDDLRSYLQPGYREGLAGAIELTDEQDRPAPLPDSNCVIVVEKS